MDAKKLEIKEGRYRTRGGDTVTLTRSDRGVFVSDKAPYFSYATSSNGGVLLSARHEDDLVASLDSDETPATTIEPDKTTLTAEPDEQPTLRDMFAMAALQGALAGRNAAMKTAIDSAETVASQCYVVADAMLAARKAGAQ